MTRELWFGFERVTGRSWSDSWEGDCSAKAVGWSTCENSLFRCKSAAPISPDESYDPFIVPKSSAEKQCYAETRMDTLNVTRSPLRWAGSKRKLLPTLKRLAPVRFRRYVEPFCGSLCLYVALKPASAFVGDINEELVNFYRMIAWRPKAIASATHLLRRDEATYYELRQHDPLVLSAQERAVRFLYLNRFCFNGVYRTNRQGFFNVARGKHMGSIPSVQELVWGARSCCTYRLRGSQRWSRGIDATG